MDIQYDTSIEVTEAQYKVFRHSFNGVVAFREDNGKFFIKLWVMSFAKHVQQVLRYA